MNRPNVYGTRQSVASDNDPVYVAMARAAVKKLQDSMSEKEFAAWQWRAFGRFGNSMETTGKRHVWIAAQIEIAHPMECTCVEGSCLVCQSFAHVSEV